MICTLLHEYSCVMYVGTGDVKDRGAWVGKNYAVNVPLHDGMDDESYRAIFRPVISKVIREVEVVVMVVMVVVSEAVVAVVVVVIVATWW